MFLFLFRRLANCSLCSTETTLSFSAGPILNSSASSPLIRATSTSLQFLFSFSLTLALSSSYVFPFTSISLAGTVYSLLYYQTTITAPPRTLVLIEKRRGLVRREALLLFCNPLLPLSSYLSYPLLSFLVLSYLNSSTRRLPRFSLRNSCSLATPSLVFTATDTAFCKLLNL